MSTQTEQPTIDRFKYDDKIARQFLWATLIWGTVGMLVGFLLALQMVDWRFNFGLEWLSFGRLRPLHTNAVIFAFAANGFFAACYYSTQRLLKTRMFSDAMSQTHFWGWQLIIVAAAICYPLGLNQAREYAELIWPIDIAVTLIWVVFAANFFLTLKIRREKHIYVAIWFYIASILAVAVLHIVNNLAIPVTATLSYPLYSGVADALIQWWYGHNAVGFLLTTPFLGLMYYFLPKAADRPVFSYRLSIIHFWGLVFIYIWAGPHHLLYSALPEWVQSLGMVFSIMLLAPSWGGMLNGLYTLRGAWHKVREEPVLKFFVAAVTAYGMSTFEGPLLSIKAVNKISHFTDWTIAHVHVGALGWVGFMIFGLTYYLIPKLYKTTLYSKSLANAHFWIGLIGIVLYALSMWVSGASQALMWLATNADGTLAYPDFMEIVIANKPMYWIRALGGFLYLASIGIMFYNLYKSLAGKSIADEKIIEAPRLAASCPLHEVSAVFLSPDSTPASTAHEKRALHKMIELLHHWLEGWPLAFTIMSFLALSVGGLIQIIPMLLIEHPAPLAVHVKPYTPLELAGRDIYIREGCYNCHSQQVRPIVEEEKRYGPVSRAYEYVYDRPFQWGSKRTGPDLHRVGGKYPDLWHYRHLEDPRSTSPKSLMPSYAWLTRSRLTTDDIKARLRVLKKLGSPYSEEEIMDADKILKAQAQEVAARLKEQGGIEGVQDTEVVAMIAYLQRLGLDAPRGDAINGGSTSGVNKP